MKPLDSFPGHTRILGKPKNMTDDQCASLAIRDTEMAGFPAMESVWELSDEDIESIKKSKRISLTILGQNHPPAAVQVSPLAGSFAEAVEDFSTHLKEISKDFPGATKM